MIDDARAHAAYLAYRVGAELARVVPPAIGELVAVGAARVVRAARPARRAQVARTLTRVTRGEVDGAALDRAVGEVFANYARYWYELFRLQHAPTKWILDHFEVTGFEHLEAAVAGGRGAILALPHLGNWDVAGAYLAARGLAISAVAEVVRPPELFDWFVAARRRLGIEVLALGPDAVGRAARALAANRVVCLLADRDLAGTGIPVEFFGEATTVPGGPALLALRTGAPLLPGAVYFRPDGGHSGRIAAPIPAQRRDGIRADVARVTVALVRHMEDAIREAPEQWLVMQPNWPSDRAAPGRKR